MKNNITKNNDKFKSSGEIKLWFPFWDNRSLFFRSKNKEIKLHYDHGIVNVNNKKFNFFGSFQVQKDMQNPIVKAGCTLLEEQYNISHRVKLTP